MPFNLKETIGALNHLLLALEHRLFNRPADYHLKKLAALSCLETPACRADKAALCPICRYALAGFELPGGWRIETCSASQAQEIYLRARARLILMPASSKGNAQHSAACLPENKFYAVPDR